MIRRKIRLGELLLYLDEIIDELPYDVAFLFLQRNRKQEDNLRFERELNICLNEYGKNINMRNLIYDHISINIYKKKKTKRMLKTAHDMKSNTLTIAFALAKK
jgi:hypothetical protein